MGSKYPTLGLSSLDDFPANSNSTGFNNLAATTLVPSARGFDLSTSILQLLPVNMSKISMLQLLEPP